MSFTVLEPGPQTTLQAGPRRGLRHQSIPSSGAMDLLSAALATRLCGNDQSTPLLEVTFGGLVMRAEGPCTVAVTGSASSVFVDDQPFAAHQTIDLNGGQVLSVPTPSVGMRQYIAVCGGFKADEKLGSSSTLLATGWGGFKGRALKAGDRLETLQGQGARGNVRTPPDLQREVFHSTVLRITAAPERKNLSPAAEQRLFGRPFRAARQIDRVGIRLQNNALSMKPGCSIIESGPVFPGIIQCPPDGNPIILGPDSQTTGGYPRIGSVITADLYLLGQIRPGTQVQFFECNTAQSRLALKALHRQTKDWLGEDWLDPWL